MIQTSTYAKKMKNYAHQLRDAVDALVGIPAFVKQDLMRCCDDILIDAVFVLHHSRGWKKLPENEKKMFMSALSSIRKNLDKLMMMLVQVDNENKFKSIFDICTDIVRNMIHIKMKLNIS